MEITCRKVPYSLLFVVFISIRQLSAIITETVVETVETEIEFGRKNSSICGEYFQCVKTSRRGYVTCIPKKLRCDNVNDCADGSDEKQCGTNHDVTEEPSATTESIFGFKASAKKCGVSAYKPVTANRLRIVSGNIAIEGSWPWQINLYHRNKQMCGGTLIRDDVVLTAAHCFLNGADRVPSSWVAVIGDQDSAVTEATEQSSPVARIISHAQFDVDSMAHDIALLQLRRPFRRNTHANVACMPTFDTLKAANRLRTKGQQMYCYVTGFGDTMDTFGEGLLKQAKVPIVKPGVCNSTKSYDGYIKKKQICAGFKEGAHDACQGDSGGPLVCLNSDTSTWEVHGIVSFGDGCGKKNKYGVYTSVYRTQKWINAKLKTL